MRLGWRERRAGFRGLTLFWAGFLLIAAGLALVLQILGPPQHRPHAASGGPAQQAAARLAELGPAASAAPGVTSATPTHAPGRANPGPIARPDPALLAPDGANPGRFLPRVAADGRTSAEFYARGYDPADPRPRIGILLAGVGLNGADSEDAVRALPGEITLAISPYAIRPEGLLAAARASGHEFLIAVPMEPQGYPINDAGDHALLTGATPEQNAERLDWALSRITGYVGATSALGLLRGERFAGYASQMTPVLRELGERGLLFIDARPGQLAPAEVWGRSIDLVVDEPAVRTEIDVRLADLERIARDKGSALGLVGAVRPVTIDRLAAWANGLAAKGLALAPVSALVAAPKPQGAVH